ncbi:hypothetical protein BSKO_01350 [Bryopsis sp. KO-2023]|nr:hypothetical protein BSKO_01350 [Bryopsis sp. KO-2023]
MSGKTVGSLFLVTLLFGVILSSGVEARRLNQASISIESDDGRQRGDIQVDGDERFASSFSTGTRRASASARISSTPTGESAQVGAIGDDADGNIQGVGASVSNQAESRTPVAPAPSRPGPPRSTVSVSGSGTATVGGTGSTSVTISGQGSTETTEEKDEMEAEASPPAVSNEDLEDTPEPTQPVATPEVTPEPKPAMMEEEEEQMEAPIEKEAEAVQVAAPAPVPAAQQIVVDEPIEKEATPAPVQEPETIIVEESSEEEEGPTTVSISTGSLTQEVTVDGKSGPRVCLTSDTSMLEELLDEGYDVTILTPTSLGYELTMMVRSGYATSETTFLLDHVPEDVQELCNYDPEAAPLPARHVQGRANPSDADRILRDLCESRMVLYSPQLLDACWNAGYLTYFDLAVLG